MKPIHCCHDTYNFRVCLYPCRVPMRGLDQTLVFTYLQLWISSCQSSFTELQTKQSTAVLIQGVSGSILTQCSLRWPKQPTAIHILTTQYQNSFSSYPVSKMWINQFISALAQYFRTFSDPVPCWGNQNSQLPTYLQHSIKSYVPYRAKGIYCGHDSKFQGLLFISYPLLTYVDQTKHHWPHNSVPQCF